MTANRFGGGWTVEKLDVLKRYLAFYTQALSAQPTPERPFKLVYIDAFAGTGRCRIKQTQGEGTIAGSASIALDTPRPFSAYHFIEPKAKHLTELRHLVEQHPLAERCHVHPGTADDALLEILKRYDWRSHRGVIFLDPFGLQCSWQTLERVAATRALDVFFLLSVSGLFRNAAIDASALKDGKHEALTRTLGTDDWFKAWYQREQGDLFGPPSVTRDPGWEQIVEFASARLTKLFPEVLPPRLLKRKDGPPLFALYLVVSNPGTAARQLAGRVGRDILTRLQ